MKEKVMDEVEVVNIFKDGSTVFNPETDMSDIIVYIINSNLRNKAV